MKVNNSVVVSSVRFRSTQAQAAVANGAAAHEARDSEWDNALPFSKIPGPNVFQMLKSFAPGGEFTSKVILVVSIGAWRLSKRMCTTNSGDILGSYLNEKMFSG